MVYIRFRRAVLDLKFAQCVDRMPNDKKKPFFLVTGGTGFLGANLCRYLHAQGYRVRAIDLLAFEDAELASRVEFIQGDIRDRVSVEKASDGCDIIVHCAAALPLWKEAEIRSVNVDGTRILLETAQRKNIKRFVYISSTAVYGIPKKHPIFEDDPRSGVGPYGQSKIEAEDLCVSYRSRMCVPILRPKSFIGPGRLGVFDVLFDWIRRGKNIPIIGAGRNLYQLLHVDDLDRAIELAALADSTVANDTFNIGAEKFGTMLEDYGALLRHAGFGKHVVPTPAKLLIPLLSILHSLGISPLYQWVYETADKDSFVSIEKAKEKLGWIPKKSNQQTLIETYEWYLKNHDRFQGKSGVTHRVPWNQGILKWVSYFF